MAVDGSALVVLLLVWKTGAGKVKHEENNKGRLWTDVACWGIRKRIRL